MLAWSPEIIDKVKTLFLSGHSDSKIAEKLAEEDNFIVTRNAIIGKRHREGITRDDDDPRPKFANAPRSVRTPDHVNGSTTVKLTRASRAKKVHQDAPKEAGEPVELIAGFRHLSLMELNATTCRYPHGDQTFTFCGLTPFEGLPYCAHHARLAYQAPAERSAA